MRFDDAPPVRAASAARAVPPPPPRPASPAEAPAAAPTGNGSAEDLFEQLRSRLADAERQSARHTQLEEHISALETRSAQLEAALAEAQAEAQAAVQALADLKHHLRQLVG
jgi:septal ring factor EnvC (AmiA/AmiB activator)